MTLSRCYHRADDEEEAHEPESIFFHNRNGNKRLEFLIFGGREDDLSLGEG